jgi:hypothetical protein
MTEAEWLAAIDPAPMLDSLRGKASGRKLRLFGCTCVRQIWSLLGEDAPAAVGVAENYADGLASKAALRRARWEVRDERYGLETGEGRVSLRWVACWLAETVATVRAYDAVVAELKRLTPYVPILQESELSTSCEVVRDIFGNPFRSAKVAPGCLNRNGGTVRKLGQAIYDERAFDRLPVLADALEDAGCTDAAILSHCRAPGPHVRGCWVVDLLLGKG